MSNNTAETALKELQVGAKITFCDLLLEIKKKLLLLLYNFFFLFHLVCKKQNKLVLIGRNIQLNIV